MRGAYIGRMENANAAPAVWYLVKCNGCKTVARVTVPASIQVKRESIRTGGIIGVPGSATFEKRERRIKVPNFDGHGYLAAALYNSTRCWTCARYLKIDQIAGRTTEHACNAKCLASKGPLCECACGGKNHGGSYEQA